MTDQESACAFPDGAPLAERARNERFRRLSDADLGAIAYDAKIHATPVERRAAACALAARTAERRERLRLAPDETLATMALNRRDPDRPLAIDILARRILARADAEAEAKAEH